MLDAFTWFHGLMLAVAILLEVVANICLKLSKGFKRRNYGVLSIALVMAAFGCLYLALPGFSLAVAYAVWGGVGLLATAIVGWVLFGQRIRLTGWMGMVLMVGGVLLMKFA